MYCWKCGSQVADDSTFCHKCGATLSPVQGPGSRTGFESMRDDKTVQDLWVRRIFAFGIDALFVSIVVSIIAVVATIPFLIGASVFQPPGLSFAWWGVWFGGLIPLILLAYFILADAFYGRTLGKAIMGLRVTRADGRPIDLWQSLVRNISKIHLVLLILDLAAGLGMRGEMSQKFSDRYVGTKVQTIGQMRIIS